MISSAGTTQVTRADNRSERLLGTIAETGKANNSAIDSQPYQAIGGPASLGWASKWNSPVKG